MPAYKKKNFTSKEDIQFKSNQCMETFQSFNFSLLLIKIVFIGKITTLKALNSPPNYFTSAIIKANDYVDTIWQCFT